jgi:cold shock CspA family protein
VRGTIKEVTGCGGVLIPDDGSRELFFDLFELRQRTGITELKVGQRLEYDLLPVYAINLKLAEEMSQS